MSLIKKNFICKGVAINSPRYYDGKDLKIYLKVLITRFCKL